MTKSIILSLFIFSMVGLTVAAQEVKFPEKHGKTLNLGIGAGGYSGYYKHIGRPVPVFHADYEFDVVNNFTLAPSVSFYTYGNSYYWGNENQFHPYKYYHFREIAVPISVKGTYYFDKLLKAGPKWDFYAAASLGFAIVNRTWDGDYYGDKNYYNKPWPVFADVHVGAEFHFSKRLGTYLDLSNGVSTIGLAIH